MNEKEPRLNKGIKNTGIKVLLYGILAVIIIYIVISKGYVLSSAEIFGLEFSQPTITTDLSLLKNQSFPPLPTSQSESSNPDPVINKPIRYYSESDIPGSTSMEFTVPEGDMFIITAGPVCVYDYCFPGGESRGSILILFPSDMPYLIYSLIPFENWFGKYHSDFEYWELVAESIANEMLRPGSKNCTSHCTIIDIIVLEGNHVIFQGQIP